MSNDAVDQPAEESTQTFAEFLESSPPNQTVAISDLATEKYNNGSHRDCLKTPEISIHCPSEACNGLRFFRCVAGSFVALTGDMITTYLKYRCSNCQNSEKLFSISANYDFNTREGWLYKFGEVPTFGPPTAARLLKLIGPDRDLFLKGRRCENQGLGIGAFVYYRRVVENQKNRILQEIIKVLNRIGSSQESLTLLSTAIDETQFSKALEIAKPAIPESLLINGHNPLKLLHNALSNGIHNLSDEECLGYASSIRIVLNELSERLSQALKDEAELIHAIARLTAPKSA